MSFWQGLPPILQAAVKTSGSVRDIAEVVGMITEPKIAKLQEKGGYRSTFGIIKAFLVAMNNNLHIDNSLTPANIENIARMLTSDSELRWWLTLADIDLLCRQIVQGRFGKFYGHFSESEFNECLIKYCNERTELHRVASDNTSSAPGGAVLEEIGYKVDEHGQLVVPESMKGNGHKNPMRYLYDAAGRIVGENPAYWDKARPEKSDEEMKLINENNRLQELALKIMDRDNVGFWQATLMARKEMEQNK